VHRQNIFQFFSRIVFDSCAVSSYATDKKTSCTQMLFDHIYHHLFRRLLMSLPVLIESLHIFLFAFIIFYFCVGTSVVKKKHECHLPDNYVFIVRGCTVKSVCPIVFSDAWSVNDLQSLQNLDGHAEYS
jgi:hypothetical protein